MGSPINNTAGVAFSGGFPTAPSAGVATANTPGVIRIRSGSNTDSGYKYGNSNTQLITGGEQYEVIFNPATLTNSTMRFGFYDAPPPLNVVDGAYLGVSGGIMFGRTASDDGGAGGNTATGTSFNLVAGTWYRARVTVNSNATRVDFYLYNLSGTQLWTDNVTTNIPTASGRETGSGVSAMNSAASTNIVHLDYMAQWWDKPLVR